MGTTVSKTTFFSTTTEELDINGVKQRAIRRFAENKVTDYSHRILTLPADSTSTVLTLGAANAGGQVSADDLSYVRVSNLDDTNSIRLVINMADAANGSFHIEVGPLKSHLVCTKRAAIVPDGQNFTAYSTISTIQAVTPASSTIDIELFLASK